MISSSRQLKDKVRNISKGNSNKANTLIRNFVLERVSLSTYRDNISFQIKSTRAIMEEFDYPGIRVMLEATLDRMRQPIKIDISTDDAITPEVVEYDYKLIFEVSS